MYKKLSNELRRETELACELWWMKECNELEKMDRHGRLDQMYSRIKQIAGHGKSKRISDEIWDNKVEMITESVEVKNRWKQYVEELYDKKGKPILCDLGIEDEVDVQEDDKGSRLLESEVLDAIKQSKDHKAEGEDGIPA